jgi:hypothetical protein
LAVVVLVGNTAVITSGGGAVIGKPQEIVRSEGAGCSYPWARPNGGREHPKETVMNTKLAKILTTAVGAAAFAAIAAGAIGVPTASAEPPNTCLTATCQAGVTHGLNPQPLPPGFRFEVQLRH